MRGLSLWREPTGNVLLEPTPTGEEEERNLFDHPVASPRDLNEQILKERIQDMNERVIFADRAFFVTLVWVFFLVGLSAVQIAVSFAHAGLSDAQFVTVVTTTTASVFGFWLLVGRYLHRDRRDGSLPLQHTRRTKAAGRKPNPNRDETSEPP